MERDGSDMKTTWLRDGRVMAATWQRDGCDWRHVRGMKDGNKMAEGWQQDGNRVRQRDGSNMPAG
jgi:hypothetical protein